jgi:ankyrin repeat protein
MDELTKCLSTKSALRRALNNLPRTLAETYKRVISRMDPQFAPLAHRVLQWLVYTRQPLTLYELASLAPLISCSSEYYDSDNVLGDERDILTICSGLVVASSARDLYHVHIWRASPYVSLAHFSVKEYLIWECDALIPTFNPRVAHISLAETCLATLQEVGHARSIDFAYRRAIVDKLPLASYAARWWSWHIKEGGASHEPSLQGRLKVLFDPSSSVFPRWIELHDTAETSEGLLTKQDASFSLYYASLTGYPQIVEWLVRERGANIHAKASKNAIHVASKFGHREVVEALIALGADVTVADGQGNTALHYAASEGHEDVLRLLVEKSGKMDCKSRIEPTIIHEAAEGGHINIVRWILDRGVDVTTRDRNGDTALHLAASGGHEDTVRLLLERGANLATQNNAQSTALHMAATNGHTKVVRLLLDSEANIETRDINKWTPLGVAIGKDCEETVSLLIKRKANPNIRNIHGITPLIRASQLNLYYIARMLLVNGAEVDRDGYQKWDEPLEKIVPVISTYPLKTFAIGSERSVCSNLGWTALHWASAERHKEIIRLLLQYGANPNHADYENWSPLWISLRFEDEKTVQLLLEHGADSNLQDHRGQTMLYEASTLGFQDIASLLLTHGANVNAQAKFKKTALHAASMRGHLEIAQLLLDYGAEPDMRDQYGGTALQCAAMRGHYHVMKLLLYQNADVNNRDHFGGTALHCASRRGQEDIVRLLLDKGADINAVDNDGRSALWSAFGWSRRDVVHLLMKRGAEVNIHDSTGVTPLSEALGKSHEDIALYVLGEAGPARPDGLDAIGAHSIYEGQPGNLVALHTPIIVEYPLEVG